MREGISPKTDFLMALLLQIVLKSSPEEHEVILAYSRSPMSVVSSG
jgi:hypothetical protein